MLLVHIPGVLHTRLALARPPVATIITTVPTKCEIFNFFVMCMLNESLNSLAEYHGQYGDRGTDRDFESSGTG
jgi:hypothetical protein